MTGNPTGDLSVYWMTLQPTEPHQPGQEDSNVKTELKPKRGGKT